MELESECAGEKTLIMIIALIKGIKKYFYTEKSNLINKLKRNKHIKSTKTQKNMLHSAYFK